MTGPDNTGILAGEPELEASLIGRVMMGYKGETITPPALAPSRLIIRRHQLIWGAVVDQHRKGAPYDPPSIVSVLRERGQLEQAGGPAYVSALGDKAGAPESVSHYVARIKAAAARRAFGQLGRAVSGLALRGPEEALEGIKSRYHTLIRRADSLCDLASRNGHSASLKRSSAYQILTEPMEPIRWIFEPWLAPQDIVVMAGESGLGKSWLALDLMFALALGKPWLGLENRFERRARVLYLDEENNRRLVRHRITKLSIGLDLGTSDLDPANSTMDYALENGVNLDDPASLDLLKRECEQLRPDFIIVDSLIRIHHRDENSNTDMSNLIGGVIKPLARNCGAGAVIIHHLGKQSKERPASNIADRIRGASAIRGDADQIWGVEKDEDGIRITHIKCRMDREASPVRADLEDTQFGTGLVVTFSDEEADAQTLLRDELSRLTSTGALRPYLVGVLEASGLKAASRVASKVLGRLHRQGAVRKRKEGRAVRYWLTEDAPGDSE